jgi:DNA-binding response OmpR family regulator
MEILAVGLDDHSMESVSTAFPHNQVWARPATDPEPAGTQPAIAIVDGEETREKTLELCRTVRRRAGDTALPIVVALERWQASQVQYVLELEATRCVIKPFDAKELGRAVRPLTPTE